MSDAVKESCEKCRYWLDESDEGAGLCRRYAPRPVHYNVTTRASDIADLAIWPVTGPYDWCGEYWEK
jgi:hypothetical protein